MIEYDREELIKFDMDREKVRQENWSKALLNLVNDADGRRIFRTLLKECGIYRRSYTGNSETYFNEGKRDVGLWLINEIQRVKPSAYTQMLLEEYSENKQLEKEKEQWLKQMTQAY